MSSARFRRKYCKGDEKYYHQNKTQDSEPGDMIKRVRVFLIAMSIELFLNKWSNTVPFGYLQEAAGQGKQHDMFVDGISRHQRAEDPIEY